jgi:hypothetical protein
MCLECCCHNKLPISGLGVCSELSSFGNEGIDANGWGGGEIGRQLAAAFALTPAFIREVQAPGRPNRPSLGRSEVRAHKRAIQWRLLVQEWSSP